MAADSGGRARVGRGWLPSKPILSFTSKLPHHHHPDAKGTRQHEEMAWEGFISKGKALLQGTKKASTSEGRRRSLSDSDMMVFPTSPDGPVVFEYRRPSMSVTSHDFTLYEEDEEEEEEEEEDMLTMSGFSIYEEATDSDSKDGSASGDKFEGFIVNAILPDGERVTLSGQRGMRVRDLVTVLLTEHKMESSPRVKHAIHRIPLNEDADASMLQNQTIILENRETQNPKEAVDRCHAIILEMLSTEREYHDLIQSAVNIYQQPLRKLPSLCNSDSKTLFGGLEPLLKLSSTLIEQLEESASTWDPDTTEIGHMFHKDFWLEYGKYYTSYKIGKLLLLYLRHHNSHFVATCKELRGAARHSLDSLLLLPVQRVSQYDKYISELYNRRSPRHSDSDNLKEAASTVRTMVKDREDEVGQAENENKLQQVQDRFPNDDLQLMERDVPKAEKFKAAAARRRSAPTTVLRSAFTSNKSKSNERPGLQTTTSFTDQQAIANMDHQGRLSPPALSNNNNRQYIMESPVQSTVGVQTQSRYLFLFNDVLIIAKPNKSGSTFRLKHRLRVSELWMATCIEDVCEVSKPADCSFVLGWPTTNCVLTFISLEERNLWWHCLEKHIDTQRDKEELKSLSVRVINKENKATAQAEQTQLTLQVGIADTAKKLLSTCMEKFSLESEDVNEYQLWVRSSKETGMYPLIGHELPYAIKMSHLRDVLAKYDDLYYPEDEDQMLSFAEKELPEHKCQFILRRMGKTNAGTSLDTTGVQKRFRKAKKSPFKLSLKRSMSNKPSDGPLSPSGKLFGIALPILCPDNSLPKPIINIITTLYNNGPFFTGIFRKSANARICREVRAKLDAGEDVNMDELPISVAAALLKEFLRSLPDSVFLCELYENWINTNNIEDVVQRIEAVKSLLDKLPAAHIMVFHHIFCMLHYVNLHNDENNMNAHNLAICVAPSMVWPPLSAGALAQAHATKKVPTLVKFMIEHSLEIFGEDVVKVFGDPPIRQDGSRRRDSSGDSDSLHSGHDPLSLKRDDSSLESIERELYEHDLSPSPRTLHWSGQVLSPSTLSRDSGLTSSNNELYPESEASDTTDSGVESKKETSGSNSSMGSQTGLRQSRSAVYVRDGMDIGFLGGPPSPIRRRDSEPPEIARMKGKRIVVRGSRSAGVTSENSPDTSDNEMEISPETMKMLEDLNREGSLKLFSEFFPDEPSQGRQQTPRRPQNAHGHSQPVTPSENAESVRPKSLHSISNNSQRPSKFHSPSSSSSSEGLFPVHAMSPRSKPVQHESVHRQLSDSKLQRSVPVKDRPKTLAIRPIQTNAPNGAQPKQMHSTPPREFFPRDATQTSLQDSRPQGVMKSQSDPHIQDKRKQQRDAERERVMRKMSPIRDVQHRDTPPSYQEAMNRRALFHRNMSVDSAGLRINPVKSQWQRQRQAVRPKGTESSQSRPNRPPLRAILSQDDKTFYEDSYHEPVMERGIIYLSSDSESSDEDTVDIESLKLYKSHPANLLSGIKAPSVRRTSSDRTESRDSRASSLIHSQEALQRSSSERRSPLDTPTKGAIFFSQDTTLKPNSSEKDDGKTLLPKPQFSRRITSPVSERRNVAVTSPQHQLIKRSLSVEASTEHKQVGRSESNTSTTSVDSGLSPRTALHFPFPDPHAEPPSLSHSKLKTSVVDGKGDRVSDLRSDEEFKQKILQARRHWQKQKQPGSTDSGACLEDLDSIEFTEESYV